MPEGVIQPPQWHPGIVGILYLLEELLLTRSRSSYGIVELTPIAHRQDDLNLFYSTLEAQIPSGHGPIIESIDGGTIDVPEYSGYNAEADLDLEYAIALGKL